MSNYKKPVRSVSYGFFNGGGGGVELIRQSVDI